MVQIQTRNGESKIDWDIVLEHYNTIRKIAYAMVPAWLDRDRVVQETCIAFTFFAAKEKLAGREIESPKAVIRTIVRRRRQYLQRRYTREHPSNPNNFAFCEAEAISSTASAMADQELVDYLMTRLGKDAADMLRRRFWHGQPLKEIAEHEGCDVSTVQRRIKRLLLEGRNILEQLG